ncbi:hypothetical protein CW736_06025 [Nonlabens sp. MB-3u-79]|nr:hypothetical protein CW736_06025 [Nonlabens sp. MB-3u-79]
MNYGVFYLIIMVLVLLWFYISSQNLLQNCHYSIFPAIVKGTYIGLWEKFISRQVILNGNKVIL